MAGEWQPIETAPRDGSIIRVRFKGFAPFDARWHKDGWQLVSYTGHPKPTEWERR